MTMTEQQKEEIKQVFRLRRKRQIILSIPLIFLVIALLFMEDKVNSGSVLGIPADTAGVGFFVFVIGSLLFSFRNWRCPSCNKYLGKRINPKFCSSCGVGLQ
jgi:hypothetical protein